MSTILAVCGLSLDNLILHLSHFQLTFCIRVILTLTYVTLVPQPFLDNPPSYELVLGLKEINERL
jgi:hypothetical protein